MFFLSAALVELIDCYKLEFVCFGGRGEASPYMWLVMPLAQH